MKFENIEPHYVDQRREDLEEAMATIDALPITATQYGKSPTKQVEISHHETEREVIQIKPLQEGVRYENIETILGESEQAKFGGETNSLRIQWRPKSLSYVPRKIHIYGAPHEKIMPQRGGISTQGLEDNWVRLYLDCVERRDIKKLNEMLDKIPKRFRFSASIHPISLDTSILTGKTHGTLWLRPHKNFEPITFEGIELFDPELYKISYDEKLSIETKSKQSEDSDRYCLEWTNPETDR